MMYSIRMRAAKGGAHEKGGHHVSGAERIVPNSNIHEVTEKMIERALHHAKGRADYINITIEAIEDDSITYINALPIKVVEADSKEVGREKGKQILMTAQISEIAVDKAIDRLTSLSKNMRGAILLDAISGERLDTSGERGIRVSHLDAAYKNDILSHKFHMQEALVLASKVANSSNILGELCWSDDPDYIVGYVACNGVYYRIRQMKDYNDPMGGRVFFIRPGTVIKDLVHYLEEENILVRV